jgi:hypothetical protein
MVSFAHDVVDELSASPQNDASVGSIVSTGEQRVSQHDMGVIILDHYIVPVARVADMVYQRR